MGNLIFWYCTNSSSLYLRDMLCMLRWASRLRTGNNPLIGHIN